MVWTDVEEEKIVNEFVDLRLSLGDRFLKISQVAGNFGGL